VSVIVPAYNAGKYLREAIESILAQQYRPLEVIVIDDGSSDDSASIAESFGPPVRCYQQANCGPAVARNEGLAQSRGDFITFLDADDLYCSGALDAHMRRFNAECGLEIVIGRQQYIRPVSAVADVEAFERVDQDQLTLSLATSLIRREVFGQVGWFDPSMRYCDDWDWFLRARELGIRMRLHRDTVLTQRLHGENMTRQREVGQKYQMLMFKRSLQRRRSGGQTPVSLPPLSTFLEAEQGHMRGT
jgi:glycosyltransferase involved in cell wall biosynthesis